MKIFLATHGHMASGMKSSINILMGSSDDLTAFDAYIPGEETSVGEKADEFLSGLQEGETALLISDMYGGSVNQALSLYSERENVYVITGITLSLLLELMCHTEEKQISEDQLESYIESARALTKLVKLDFEVRKDDSFF